MKRLFLPLTLMFQLAVPTLATASIDSPNLLCRLIKNGTLVSKQAVLSPPSDYMEYTYFNARIGDDQWGIRVRFRPGAATYQLVMYGPHSAIWTHMVERPGLPFSTVLFKGKTDGDQYVFTCR